MGCLASGILYARQKAPRQFAGRGLSYWTDGANERVIVASVDAGAMKPDPRIFARAVRRLGVQPAEAWHVGDNYWADVLGARAAGIIPVLVDRPGAVPRPDCLFVRSLDQVLDLLDGGTDDGEVAA